LVTNSISHCQLIISFDITREIADHELVDLIKTVKVAALILYDRDGDEMRLQRRASILVPLLQAQGVAVLIAGDARIAVRVGADGIHCEDGFQLEGEHDNKPAMMIGYGNIKDRHRAMELGEAGADYIMFGKLDADNEAAPHPRNLRLAAWWSPLMEVPCIVQAGSDHEMIDKAIETGCEFIAIEEMIFSCPDPRALLIKISQRLDNDVPIRHNNLGRDRM